MVTREHVPGSGGVGPSVRRRGPVAGVLVRGTVFATEDAPVRIPGGQVAVPWEGAAVSRRGARALPTRRPSSCFTYRRSIDSHRDSMEGWAMGKLTVRALRAVLVMVLAGTLFVQALMVWALATDPEDGSLPLTPLRVITILGIVSVQVALVCVWRLVTMVRRGTVFSHAAFRYVDVVIGAIVAAALVWFAVTVLNAPGQRADPGVTVIMGGVGVAILGVALIVLVLRMLLAQAVARDIEAAQMQAELDEVI